MDEIDLSPVDRVIEALHEIIEHSEDSRSRIGYFACLYLHVTTTFRDGLRDGEFDHPQLMAKLDEVFAQRYLDALKGWRERTPITSAWQLSFHGTQKHSLIVTQQLLSAANAHINLDLGIAVATAVPQKQMAAFESDFDRINEMLASLFTMVQDQLAEVWWPLQLVNRFFGRLEHGLLNIVMHLERDRAWAFANNLAEAPQEAWPELIEARNREVTELGHAIVKPPNLVRLGLLIIRLMEIRGVDRIINLLKKKHVKRT